MKATAKDLRFKTKELLESVKRGEEVVITYRGKPCAKLIPISDERENREGHPLFGIWSDHEATKEVDGYVRTIR